MGLLEKLQRRNPRRFVEVARRVLVPLAPIEIISHIVPSAVVLDEDAEDMSRFLHGIAYTGSRCGLQVGWFVRQDVDLRSAKDTELQWVNVEVRGSTRCGLQIIPERGVTGAQLRQRLYDMAAYMAESSIREKTLGLVRKTQGGANFPESTFNTYYDRFHTAVLSSAKNIR